MCLLGHLKPPWQGASTLESINAAMKPVASDSTDVLPGKGKTSLHCVPSVKPALERLEGESVYHPPDPDDTAVR